MTSRPSLTPPPQRLPPLTTYRSLHRAIKPSTQHRGDISPYLRAEGPYVTLEMLKQQEEKEKKKRWITKKGFNTAVKCEPRFIPNYVQAAVGANPSTHQFRQCIKSRWLAGDFKPARYHSLHRSHKSALEIQADHSFH